MLQSFVDRTEIKFNVPLHIRSSREGKHPKMPPPYPIFRAAELPDQLQKATRKQKAQEPIVLQKCQLLELLQYDCQLEEGDPKHARIVCEPVERLFRK
jgi:hypothetical protein